MAVKTNLPNQTLGLKYQGIDSLSSSTGHDTRTIVLVAPKPHICMRGRVYCPPELLLMNTDNTRTTAARAFVRSLNILLKFARMY